jgi:hypothetical protein
MPFIFAERTESIIDPLYDTLTICDSHYRMLIEGEQQLLRFTQCLVTFFGRLI